jgi:hypothetical protein
MLKNYEQARIDFFNIFTVHSRNLARQTQAYFRQNGRLPDDYLSFEESSIPRRGTHVPYDDLANPLRSLAGDERFKVIERDDSTEHYEASSEEEQPGDDSTKYL